MDAKNQYFIILPKNRKNSKKMNISTKNFLKKAGFSHF